MNTSTKIKEKCFSYSLLRLLFTTYIIILKNGPSNLLLDKMKSTEAFNIKVFVPRSNE